MNPLGLIFLLIGSVTLGGGVFDWEWFMNNRKARRLVWLIGRGGARVFYTAFGLAFLTLGVLVTTGAIEMSI